MISKVYKRSVYERPDCSRSTSELFGNLGLAEAAVVSQHDCRSLPKGESAQAVGQSSGRIVVLVWRGNLDFGLGGCCISFRSTSDISAAVQHTTIEVRSGAVHRLPTLIYGNESVGHNIVGRRGVAQQKKRTTHLAFVFRCIELGESLVVDVVESNLVRRHEGSTIHTPVFLRPGQDFLVRRCNSDW